MADVPHRLSKVCTPWLAQWDADSEKLRALIENMLIRNT
jgi:hypothetical protein